MEKETKEIVKQDRWKVGDIAGCIFILIFLFLFVFAIFINPNGKCLEETAKNYCEVNGLEYSGMSVMPQYFFCLEIDDNHVSFRYRFTNEELKVCRRIG